MAAELSGSEKGKNVGIIFTGILVGILMARVFSGYISEWSSWKMVYYLSAGFTVFSLAFVYFKLPSVKPTFKESYFKLISSSFYQLKRFPQLRFMALLGGIAFAVFCKNKCNLETCKGSNQGTRKQKTKPKHMVIKI